MDIRAFRTEDESAVVALWERCGLLRPWNDPREDIARKVAVQPELFLVGLANHAIVATAMAGYEGHRGWVNYVAVAPEWQRQGLGRRMMGEVERLLHSAGCPKINLQVRDTNAEALGFYSALGYTRDDVVSMGKRLDMDRTDARTLCADARRSGAVTVDRKEQRARGIRFAITGSSGEVARAYLYVMTNDLHEAPFGFMEDVFVAESERGSGLGTVLVKEVIAAAREAGCYKLIATSRTSRPKVHELYERLGFENHGVEFRMNLTASA